jgi:hypothetical protein
VVSSQLRRTAVALTVEKDLSESRLPKSSRNNIGYFGAPSDSSASANALSGSSLSRSNSYHSLPMSPSDMLEDNAASISRVDAIEAQLEEIRNHNQATHQLLQDVLTRLNPVVPPTSHPSSRPPVSRRPSSTSIPTSAGRNKNSLKPSFPPEFSGDRNSGKAFLTSCRTYIRLCPESFEDDITKIVWAMSYMKSGRAGRWATREFEQETKTGRLRFLDWTDFEDEFRKDFLPLDAEAAAINTLETTNYFQGKRTVDDYLDQFRDLVEDSGYTDPKTIVVKFRRGLNRQIASALASMASGRPSDSSPEEWYRLAIQMDQNRAAEEAFQSSHRQTHTPGLISRIPQNSKPALATSPFTSRLPPRFAHANPSPGNPVPMDIDATRKAKALADSCRRCGQVGHWAKDCPRRFDVRYMDTDELQTELEGKLAARDAVPEVPEEVTEVDNEEDFVPRDE